MTELINDILLGVIAFGLGGLTIYGLFYIAKKGKNETDN